MTDSRGPVAACVFLVGSALLLTALAVTQPYALACLAVIALGPLHVVLATRYILGRSLPALGGSTGGTLALLVAAMVLVRIVAALVPTPGRYLELIGGCAVVGWALWKGLDARRRVLGLAAVVALAAVSLLELPWYWLFLTHGHNVVPLIFLWDWARRLHPGARLAFVGANLVWASAIPAAVLSGWLDPLIEPTPPTVVTRLGNPTVLLASASPPGADPALGLRFLVVFGLMQAMHYLLWMVFFQVAGRREVTRFGDAFPRLRGWRFWVLGAGVSALVWAAYAIGYSDGRAAYGVLGALNVYLEQPVAVWLLLTALPAAATTRVVDELRRT